MKSVAIVGAGPSGKAAARVLNGEGFEVTIFDREPEGGGLLRYGYPEGRMAAVVSQRDTSRLEALGIRFEFDCELGRNLDLEELRKQHQAVLLAIGSPISRPLPIPGEDLPRVYQALDFLHAARSANPWPVGSRVVVVGGGDTSLDAAITALDLGATQAAVLYRGRSGQSPAQIRELELARGRGVDWHTQTEVRRIALPDDNTLQLEITKAGKPTTEPWRCDTVIVAIGSNRPSELLTRLGLEPQSGGTTNLPDVFTCGETLSGTGLLATAIYDGRRVAGVMAKALK